MRRSQRISRPTMPGRQSMSLGKRVRVVVALSGLVLSGLLSSLSHAQVPTGTILGTVKDASGAIVPGASVRITNELTNQTRELLTDDNGNYSAPYLPIGTYTVTIELTGFKSYRVEN